MPSWIQPPPSQKPQSWLSSASVLFKTKCMEWLSASISPEKVKHHQFVRDYIPHVPGGLIISAYKCLIATPSCPILFRKYRDGTFFGHALRPFVGLATDTSWDPSYTAILKTATSTVLILINPGPGPAPWWLLVRVLYVSPHLLRHSRHDISCILATLR